MSTEFIGFGDRLLHTSQVSEQPHLWEDLRGTTKRFLELARSVEVSIEDDGEESSSREEYRSMGAMSGSQLPPSSRMVVHTSHPSPTLTGLSDLQPSFAVSTLATLAQSRVPRSTTRHQVGSFSPRLNHGLLGGSLERSSLPFVTEYLIGNLASFATRLYLDTLFTTWKALTGELQVPGFIPSVCRYRLRHEPPNVMIELIRQQLSVMYVDNDISSSEVDPRKQSSANDVGSTAISSSELENLRPIITSSVCDLEREGGSLRDWMDPWHTQQYLTNHWGFELSSTTVIIPNHVINSTQPNHVGGMVIDLPENLEVAERPTEPAKETGSSLFASSVFNTQLASNYELTTSQYTPRLQFGGMDNYVGATPSQATIAPQSDAVTGVSPLIQKLWLETVCFGDGPRFAKQHVDAAVQSFLVETVDSGSYGYL
jgi:hypothetical protein